MALVLSSDFDGLPLEPIPRWLKLRDLLENRLASVDDERNGISDEHLNEYCTVLVSAAEESGLGSFDNFQAEDIRSHFPRIRSQVISLATKLSMRTATAHAANSVALPRTSKLKIFGQIERLRNMVAESGLSDKQKKKLNAQLDDLTETITSPRTDFGKLMTVLAAVSFAVAGTADFLANAPDAWATLGIISAEIGDQKQHEELEQLRLKSDAAPLRLEDLRAAPYSDDEIPF